jgi:hypothetical protein
MVDEIGRIKAKEALEKQIQEQIEQYLGKGGKIDKPRKREVADVKQEIRERLEVGRHHFVTPDARENER